MSPGISISFVIPVCNEEATIATLSEKIRGVMFQERVSKYEIIFVDDGSVDHSWFHIKDLIHQYPTQIKG
ncbi:glycosyltransferase, partial [Gloeocapsopsis crepidinum]